jgi:hypothetical protein
MKSAMRRSRDNAGATLHFRKVPPGAEHALNGRFQRFN